MVRPHLCRRILHCPVSESTSVARPVELDPSTPDTPEERSRREDEQGGGGGRAGDREEGGGEKKEGEGERGRGRSDMCNR